jgi:flagellin-like protein
MVTRKNDEAVSPVIGVILMVAITVILAAVIAAFVFGMSGNIQKTKIVSATGVRMNSANVTVTYQGGQDSNTLYVIKWQVNGGDVTTPAGSGVVNGTGYMFTGATSTTSYVAGTTPVLIVGASANIPAAQANSHVVGIGTFSDGQQVIFDSYL